MECRLSKTREEYFRRCLALEKDEVTELFQEIDALRNEIAELKRNQKTHQDELLRTYEDKLAEFEKNYREKGWDM
jgi:hypothetical protein